jgi:PadR family transcriptional regulator PadR
VPEGIEIQLKKGVLGFCVLALLSHRDSYAYEIASKLSHAVDMGEGTIYPLMRRMQSDGLVATYLEESPSGPPRKYYKLSDAGRDALASQLAEWRHFTAAVEGLIGEVDLANSANLQNAQSPNRESNHDA